MSSIATLLLTFVLTGVIGNRLLHAWQFRNWIKQQRFLGAEKEYLELKVLFDEIVRLAGRRLSRMQRLQGALGLEDEIVRRRLQEYDESLSEWNERLASFNVRLTILDTYDRALDLDQIQQYFVASGIDLEKLVRIKLGGQTVPKQLRAALESRLNEIQGALFRFNREVLKAVEYSQAVTYHGVEVKFSRRTVRLFSSWHLIKALFVPLEQVPSIYRSAVDAPEPRIFRD